VELAGLLAIWLLAVVSPGPAFLVLSQLAIGRSRASAFGASLGIALGAILYAALTLWGFTVVVTQVAWLGTALRIAGAVYLVYLGLSLFHSATEAEAAQPEIPTAQGDFRAGLRIGLLTAITNPKAIAFFLSLFAVALPPDLSTGAKLTLLAAGFAIELGWYFLVACLLSTGWPRRMYARARRTIDRVLGAALLLAGVRIGIADR
jgi:threonine/homoserine/homoserine lactone efflux protein